METIIRIENLKKEWITMSSLYKKSKLVDMFLPDYLFPLGKLKSYDDHFTSYGYSAIKKMVEQIETEVKKRYGEVEAKFTLYLFDEIHYILDFFEKTIARKREYIEMEYDLFGQLLGIKLDELKTHCTEMDEEVELGLEKPTFGIAEQTPNTD